MLVGFVIAILTECSHLHGLSFRRLVEIGEECFQKPGYFKENIISSNSVATAETNSLTLIIQAEEQDIILTDYNYNHSFTPFGFSGLNDY